MRRREPAPAPAALWVGMAWAAVLTAPFWIVVGWFLFQ